MQQRTWKLCLLKQVLKVQQYGCCAIHKYTMVLAAQNCKLLVHLLKNG
jgi:hypothetical protein